jgi:anthranilate synthase component II
MIILIDNYDSFTWNLYHYLGELGAETVVHRNDAVSVGQVLSARPDAIVLSPGPCTPNEAGICLDLIAEAKGSVPILGVCLGHQAIGQACGGRVVRAAKLMHGNCRASATTGGLCSAASRTSSRPPAIIPWWSSASRSPTAST